MGGASWSCGAGPGCARYESRMNGAATVCAVSRTVPSLAWLCALAACAGCGATSVEVADPAQGLPLLPHRVVRPPDAKTTMDTNPANLASAVVTYSFGQLPEYIDRAAVRL